MQLHSVPFGIVRKVDCPSSHRICRQPAATLLIEVCLRWIVEMANLKNYRKFPPTNFGSGVLVSVVLCLLFIGLVDARPPPAGSVGLGRPIREHTRYLRSSIASANPGPSRFNVNPSSSTDALSLSVFSPLDILRQNMLLEIRRKRQRHAKLLQMQSNKEILDQIGR